MSGKIGFCSQSQDPKHAGFRMPFGATHSAVIKPSQGKNLKEIEVVAKERPVHSRGLPKGGHGRVALSGRGVAVRMHQCSAGVHSGEHHTPLADGATAAGHDLALKC